MKKLVMIVIAILTSLSVFAGDATRERIKMDEVMGWTVSVKDLDVDKTLELITQLATTYTQIATPDSIEILSASTLDTLQVVTLEGIENTYGKRVKENITLTGTTVATSSTIFRYLDQASSNKECVGTITIRDQDYNTFLTSIPVGGLEAGMAQHFNGEKDTYVTGWSASKLASDDTLSFDLRFYPDDADSLDPTDGMVTRDTIFIEEEVGKVSCIFPQSIRLKAGGWLAVYGEAGETNVEANVTVFGYDVQP